MTQHPPDDETPRSTRLANGAEPKGGAWAPFWTRSAKRPRRAVYPLAGAAIALISPMGLLLLRGLQKPGALSLRTLELELHAERATYAYSAVSTLLVFVFFGWLVGRKGDALQAASSTDPLTGLWNRRYFEVRLREELARIARTDGSLAVLLVDLDRLKQINDQFGHHAGDRALQHVGARLRSTCRAMDTVARVGGDEFAVLLPGVRAEQAMEVAERILSAVATAPEVPGELETTVSIGISDTERASAKQIEALYLSADGALYQAKTQGRNRAVIAEPAPARA